MEEEIDAERTEIRKELSNLSFEDLLKLKERLGTKVYDEAMFGTKSKKSNKPETFKRVNKNRPREMSSKVPVPILQNVVPCKKAPLNRDPRFDSLCGSFDEKVFKKAYKFVDSIKSQEKDELKEELKEETDPAKKQELKYLIQRLENQERESRKRQEKEEAERDERRERMELMKKGEKPRFLKKSEKQTQELVNKFEELKKSGRLLKHIEKHRKKSTHKDRKRLRVLD